MPPPPPRPGAKGSGLNRKIAGVPAKYLLAAGLVIVGYLLYRHYRGSLSSSAGSSATPQAPTAQLPGTGDSTGGGASGGGGDIAAPTDPLANANQQAADLLSSLLGTLFPQGLAPFANPNAAPGFPQVPATPDQTGLPSTPVPQPSGGNTSPPVVASSPSVTPSSFATFANTTGLTTTVPGTLGSTITTFTPAQVAAINGSPNALRTIGSDAAQSLTTNIKYYTYKAQVPVGPGQRLKFTRGKGYYAG